MILSDVMQVANKRKTQLVFVENHTFGKLYERMNNVHEWNDLSLAVGKDGCMYVSAIPIKPSFVLINFDIKDCCSPFKYDFSLC